MDPGAVEAVARFFFLGRKADRDERKRYNMVRQFQELPEIQDPVLGRIDPAPHCAEAPGVDRKQHVLRRRCAVEHPVPFVFLE
jgi:hypothetical protein